MEPIVVVGHARVEGASVVVCRGDLPDDAARVDDKATYAPFTLSSPILAVYPFLTLSGLDTECETFGLALGGTGRIPDPGVSLDVQVGVVAYVFPS